MESRKRSFLVDGSVVYGRKDDTMRIIKLLLSDDCKSRPITPICMIADRGIGKTTVAQLIYTDRKVSAAFDARIFIPIFKGFDEKRLVKEILESLTSGPCEITELSMLQGAVKEELMSKKVLVILDGTEDGDSEFWKSLFVLLGFAEKGSVVLITTSSEEVAKAIQAVHYYNLDYLSNHACWHIFWQKAFNGQTSIQPILENVRKDLTAEGPKNTLGIKLLGGLSRYSAMENWWEDWWLSISATKSWNNIVQLIKDCYEHLPTHLKHCFTYCSLFPKNYVFSKHHVIHLWLSQGFIIPMDEHTGCQYFDELCNRSFFQHSPLHDANEQKFLMHGLIHDWAQQASQDMCIQSEDALQSIPDCIQHFSLVSSAYHKVDMEALKAGDLRSFLVINRSILHLSRILSFKNLEFLFSYFNGLRALDLSNTRVDELPVSIRLLTNLHYLGLNNTTIKGIPEEIGDLVSLQNLEARDCYYLTELPSNIISLINLHYLDITKNNGFVRMPIGMGKLINLKLLAAFNVGCDEMHSGIKELKNMDNLTRSLQISGLQNVTSTLDAKEANLKNKIYLQTLSLQWTEGNEFTDDAETIELQEKVLENLQPSTNLQELIIRNYAGGGFPLWMEDYSFSKLVSVIIDDCPNCNKLPALGELPSLQYLSIEKLFGVKTIEMSKFPSLKSLKIWEMHNLEELVVIEEGGFPHLHALSINNCPLLRSIPHFLSLVQLSIFYCTQLPHIPDLPLLQCLKIGGFQKIKYLTLPQNLTMLKKLEISYCNEPLSLVNLSKLTSIEELIIHECPNTDVTDWKPNDLVHNEDSSSHEEKQFDCCHEDINNKGSNKEDLVFSDEEMVEELTNEAEISGLRPAMDSVSSKPTTSIHERLIANLKCIVASFKTFLFGAKKVAISLKPNFTLTSKPVRVDEDELGLLKMKLEAIYECLKWSEVQSFHLQLMRELQDLRYQAEEVVEEILFEEFRVTRLMELSNELLLASDENRKREASSLFHSFTISSLTVKIKKMEVSFWEIANHMGALQLREECDDKLLKPAMLYPTSSLPNCPIYGRADDMKKLTEWLKSDGDGDGVYSVKTIVGMAGIGKTTLVQHVYNHSIIQSSFDLKIWVYVSQLYNVVEVMRKIIEGIVYTRHDSSELESLHHIIMHHLRGKRFLLVLDDMWDEDPRNWMSLQVPLNYGAPGSKVVVTTRSMKVSQIMCAKKYHLGCLTDDSTWSICLEQASRGHKITLNNNMREIGKKIALKCKGLPLAASAVGVSLSFSHEEKYWNSVLDNFLLTDSDEVNRILPALRVSYDYLPVHLKRCFAYCSLFPKGYIFEKNKLVHLWMAQGFMEARQCDLEEVGRKYFDDLLDRCFFQHSPSHYNTEEMYVIHDLYHELAKDVSGVEFNRSEEFKVQKLHEGIRHFSIVPSELHSQEAIELNSFDNQNLRSFLFVGDKLKEVPYKIKISRGFFVAVDCLRALDLSNNDIENLPSDIGNLIHLRYLSLENSRIHCLPESIGCLFNLQTLNLKGCMYLVELPKGLKLLDSLRHLFLPSSGNNHIISMPFGMSQLTSLQTLSLFAIGTEGCRIEELGNLANLKGELHVSGMNNVNDPESAQEACMQNKEQVRRLTLDWLTGDSNYPDLNEELTSEILERLRPPQNLEELTINSFGGTQLPSWLSDQFLLKLESLNLKNCNIVKNLPALGMLPSLKHLSISSMAAVRRIGQEFCGHKSSSSSMSQCSQGFPRLEALVFKKMSAWVEWVGVDSSDFPCLKYLSLYDCNMLRKLPQFRVSVKVKIMRSPRIVCAEAIRKNQVDSTRQSSPASYIQYHYRK